MTPKDAQSPDGADDRAPRPREAPSHSGRFAIIGDHQGLPDGILGPLLDQNPNPVFCASRDGLLVHANAAGAPLLAQWAVTVAQPLPRDLGVSVRAAFAENARKTVEMTVGGRHYAFAVAPVAGTRWAVLFGNDVTEHRRLEEQLRQAEKMDAVGKLAGGVVHDFGNTLSVVLSYSGLLLADLPAHDPARKDIQQIYDAGMRASRLIRQMLSFSRQQVLDPRVIDLNEIVRGIGKMLERIVGEDIDVETCMESRLGTVRVDPGHIEQVIVNLVVNARDAMPGGGKLGIGTANVDVSAEDAKRPDAVPKGRYAMLSVRDTGSGMDEATLARIFEPFFTTKEKGKGTGLGLSSVRGIIEQSGGFVRVASAVGRGSTFNVYLPRVDAAAEGPRVTMAPTTLAGSETILLVEDEDAVRAASRAILSRNGYRVIHAANAREALDLCGRHAGSIHLMVTDVVMPEMNGTELARHVRRRHPAMKILFVSGYTDESVARHGVLEPGVAFLQKPITPKAFARKVREVLDEP